MSQLHAVQPDIVTVLIEIGLCQDRVDSLLTLCQVERFNCEAMREWEVLGDVMEWLKGDKVMV